MALVRISIYNENSGNLIHEADDYSGDESDHSIYQALLKAFDEMSSLLFPDDEALVWEDEEEDEDEFSLGLIERPEPTMDELKAQGLWNTWMASASADPRAALGVSIPQRFIAGIDPKDHPDGECYIPLAPGARRDRSRQLLEEAVAADSCIEFAKGGFLTHYDATPNEWIRGIELQWGESEPIRCNEVDLSLETLSRELNEQVWKTIMRGPDLPYDLSAFDFGDTDHDFTD